MREPLGVEENGAETMDELAALKADIVSNAIKLNERVCRVERQVEVNQLRAERSLLSTRLATQSERVLVLEEHIAAMAGRVTSAERKSMEAEKKMKAAVDQMDRLVAIRRLALKLQIEIGTVKEELSEARQANAVQEATIAELRASLAAAGESATASAPAQPAEMENTTQAAERHVDPMQMWTKQLDTQTEDKDREVLDTDENEVEVVGVGKLTTLREKGISDENKKQQVMGALSSAGQPVDDDVSSRMEAMMTAKKHVGPVGQEYIESKKDARGRASFRCKLCECEFSGPDAKESHLKGRRHRLAYKRKVLRAKKEQRQMGGVRGGGEGMTPGPGPGHHSAACNKILRFPSQPDPALFTVDDGLILEKLSRLIPSNQKMDAIERLTLVCEKALMSVSDLFAERDSTPHQDRALKGVLRVGSLACGVVMADDDMVEMVAMCRDRPTVALLSDIAQRMPKFIEMHRTTWDDQATPIVVRASEQEACIDVTCEVDWKITVRITLSSHVLRNMAPVSAAGGEEAGLPLPPSLTALARIRRVNWFQVKCSGEAVLACVRLLADIRRRIETWQPLTKWHCCLLIERVVGCSPFPLGPSASLRRIFEAIAGGLLYASGSSGPGLADPCEKTRIDVLADVTAQQREDMTCSAQHALRMMAFGQLGKILDLEVAPPACFMAPETRKRVCEGEAASSDPSRSDAAPVPMAQRQQQQAVHTDCPRVRAATSSSLTLPVAGASVFNTPAKSPPVCRKSPDAAGRPANGSRGMKRTFSQHSFAETSGQPARKKILKPLDLAAQNSYGGVLTPSTHKQDSVFALDEANRPGDEVRVGRIKQEEQDSRARDSDQDVAGSETREGDDVMEQEEEEREGEEEKREEAGNAAASQPALPAKRVPRQPIVYECDATEQCSSSQEASRACQPSRQRGRSAVQAASLAAAQSRRAEGVRGRGKKGAAGKMLFNALFKALQRPASQ